MAPSWRALLLAALLAVGAGAETRVELKDSSVGMRVSNAYDPRDFEVELAVTWRQAGTVLDTVGINAAPNGSFHLLIGGDGRLSFDVYEPRSSGPLRMPNGWHSLPNAAVTQAGRECRVVVRLSGGRLTFRVDDQVRTADWSTPLSGQPVFVGDFKGDEAFGPKYHIHGGMVGTVVVRYWGKGRSEAAATGPPTPPPAGDPSAALADETGRLSGADRAAITAQLARLRQAKGISLGLVYASLEASSDAAKASRYRSQWVAQHVLAPDSAVFMIAGNRWFWQVGGTLINQLPFERVSAAWQSVSGGPPGAALVAFVGKLIGDAPNTTPTTGPTGSTSTPTTPTTPTQPPTGDIGGSAGRLEAKLRAGDAAGALALLHPDLRASTGKLFAQQPQAMTRLAALLATRRFVARGAMTAEFQVSDAGRTFPLTFTLVGGQWLLAGF